MKIDPKDTPAPMTLVERLLNKVNKVTAPWRHGRRVDGTAMDELVERQIEIESQIAGESKPELCPRCGGTRDKPEAISVLYGWSDNYCSSDFHGDKKGTYPGLIRDTPETGEV